MACASSRSHRLRGDDFRVGERSGERNAACGEGPREHEARTGGQRDENWPDWYAAYMVAEHAGKELPQ